MIQRILVAALIALSSSASFAQELYGTNNLSIRESATPGETFFDQGVRAVKSRDYEHAMAMYQVAASWAYKPAEYNLGVILAKGEGGVKVDLPRAYAWMSLAAERGDKRYIEARDRVKLALDDVALKQSEAMLDVMRHTYGDEVALVRAKAKWHETLAGATGSHVGYTGDNLQVGHEGNTPDSAISIMRNTPLAYSTKDKHGRGEIAAHSGVGTAADILGTSGVPGSTAYRDLQATDNPYDPRFSAAVVTVGEVKGTGPKKEEEKKPDETPADKP